MSEISFTQREMLVVTEIGEPHEIVYNIIL